MATSDKATQEQFAKVMGISQPDVSRLIRKGVLTRGKPIGVWLVEYGRHMREVAAGRKPESEEEGDFDLVRERARKAARESEKLEIETAKLRGELLPKQAITDALGKQYSAIRSRLLAIPVRIKAQRPELEVDAVKALKALIDETLIELSHVQLPRDITEGVRRYYSDLHAPAKPNGNGMGR